MSNYDVTAEDTIKVIAGQTGHSEIEIRESLQKNEAVWFPKQCVLLLPEGVSVHQMPEDFKDG